MYTIKDYQRVHELAYEFKNGDKEAGKKLLEAFSAFLNRYTSLLHHGYHDLNHSSIRNFIRLFVDNPTKRTAIASYKHNKGAGVCAAQETVEKIRSYFDCLTKEDVQQEIYTIFLTMVTKYKDVKPSFQNHIEKNFHFYAFRHFEKLARDPLNRRLMFSEYTVLPCNIEEGYTKVDFLTLMADPQATLDIEQKESDIELEQNLEKSNVIAINNMDCEETVSIYDDNFLDANWINGITCAKVFKNLTPFERKILKMWYVEKKTDSEIAEIFGVCRGTINNKRAKIKGKLQKEIKKLKLVIK
jgi:RNA polymerase sigma factor (sigma-70 family)